MKKNENTIIKLTLNAENLPPLTATQRAERPSTQCLMKRSTIATDKQAT